MSSFHLLHGAIISYLTHSEQSFRQLREQFLSNRDNYAIVSQRLKRRSKEDKQRDMLGKSGRSVILDAPQGAFRIEEKRLPRVREGEILIKQEMCGVCGTCVHVYNGHLPTARYPLVLGHEIVGTIDGLGKGAAQDITGEPLEKGDRVYVVPGLRCGECYFCSVANESNLCVNGKGYGFNPLPDEPPHFHGGYADYVYLNHPWSKVLKMNATPEVSVLLEPFSIGIHAVDRVWLKTGDVIVVQGAGAIGLFTLIAAKESGAAKTIMVGAPESRLKLAKQFGADLTINIEDVKDPKERVDLVKSESTGGYGADVVFECTGFPNALPEGMDMVRRGGTYVVAGHFTDAGDIPINPYYHLNNKHITLHGVWSSKISHFIKGKPILESGKYPFEEMISHKLPLASVGDAMKALSTDYRLDGREVRKIVIASDL